MDRDKALAKGLREWRRYTRSMRRVLDWLYRKGAIGDAVREDVIALLDEARNELETWGGEQ